MTLGKADGWYGVDLDGTLAQYPHASTKDWALPWDKIGDPVPRMVERVQVWRAEGKSVKILTARVFPHIDNDPNVFASPPAYSYEQECLASGVRFSVSQMIGVIQDWCALHVGERLPVTCAKDWKMIELWDDRAVQVALNTGRTITELYREHTNR